MVRRQDQAGNAPTRLLLAEIYKVMRAERSRARKPSSSVPS
jgi:hypothetical protein